MRITHTAAPRRRLALAVPAGLTLIAMAALAGCSSGSSASSAAGEPVAGRAAVAEPSASASAAPSGAFGTSAANGLAQDASANRFTPAGHQLIYTAQLTVRSPSVGSAVSRATSIATGAGGYVSTENASSDPSHPNRASATIEVKIPVSVYAATLARLSTGLGTQLALKQQAQDVTTEVADVNSRVASDEAAITQLRALLKHAGSVGGLLSVQDQINSEEGDLEAMQSQQSALDHETSFASVTITVLGPKAAAKPAKQKPAPGFTGGISGGWRAFRTSVSWFLAIIGAVAPFAGAVAVVGGLAFWIRRRLAHRSQASS